jgi:hypothetical protein
MKTFEELTRYEKTVLLACGKANNFSLSSHVPIGYIRKKIEKKQQIYVKKIMKILVSSGFILESPAGRNKTYKLSRDGLKACKLLKEEL